MPTLVHIDGAEHGVNPVTSGLSLFSTVFGTPSADNILFRSAGGGLNSYKWDATSVACSAQLPTVVFSGKNILVGSVYINVTTPGGGDRTIFEWKYLTQAAFGGITLSSAGVLKAKAENTLGFVGTQVLTNGQWYRIDFRLDMSLADPTLDWKIDGVDQPQSIWTVGVADTFGYISMGAGASTGVVINTDDDVWSNIAADYPLGEYRCLGYKPNADGAHNVGTDTWNTVTSNGGSSVAITNGTTDSWTTVDEWPPTADGNGADDWVDKTAGTNAANYVEWAFADCVENPGPNAVRMLIAERDAIAAVSAIVIVLTESGTEHATKLNRDPQATMEYRNVLYTTKPTGGAWTTAALTASTVRYYATNIGGTPRMKAVILIGAFPPASSSKELALLGVG